MAALTESSEPMLPPVAVLPAPVKVFTGPMLMLEVGMPSRMATAWVTLVNRPWPHSTPPT